MLSGHHYPIRGGVSSQGAEAGVGSELAPFPLSVLSPLSQQWHFCSRVHNAGAKGLQWAPGVGQGVHWDSPRMLVSSIQLLTCCLCECQQRLPLPHLYAVLGLSQFHPQLHTFLSNGSLQPSGKLFRGRGAGCMLRGFRKPSGILGQF